MSNQGLGAYQIPLPQSASQHWRGRCRRTAPTTLQECPAAALAASLKAAPSCDESAATSPHRQQPVLGPTHPRSQRSQTPATTSDGPTMGQASCPRETFGEDDPKKRLQVAEQAIAHLLEVKYHLKRLGLEEMLEEA